MKKYRVTAKELVFYSWVVEAETPKEAREKVIYEENEYEVEDADEFEIINTEELEGE